MISHERCAQSGNSSGATQGLCSCVAGVLFDSSVRLAVWRWKNAHSRREWRLRARGLNRPFLSSAIQRCYGLTIKQFDAVALS